MSNFLSTRCRPRFVAAACAALMVMAIANSAFADPPEITTIADMAAYPPVIATKITAVVVAGLALFFGILVVRKSLSWIKSSVKSA